MYQAGCFRVEDPQFPSESPVLNVLNQWQLLPALGKQENIGKFWPFFFAARSLVHFGPEIAGCSSDGKGPPLPVLSSRFLAVNFTWSHGLSWWNLKRQSSNIWKSSALAYLRTWPPPCRPLDPMTWDFCRTFVCSPYWHSLITFNLRRAVFLAKKTLKWLFRFLDCQQMLIDSWGWPIATAGAICTGPRTGIWVPHRFDANHIVAKPVNVMAQEMSQVFAGIETGVNLT